MLDTPRRVLGGFTLIELLVVVSIISLLSSIIFVGLGSQQARAKDAKTKAQINQLGIATALYKEGNNGQNLTHPGGFYAAYPGGTAWSDGTETDRFGNAVSGYGNVYAETLGQLVSGGLISSVPLPGAGLPLFGYSNGPAGGIFFSGLVTPPPTQGGYGSCNVATQTGSSISTPQIVAMCPSTHRVAVTLLPNGNIGCSNGTTEIIATHPLAPYNPWQCTIEDFGDGLKIYCSASVGTNDECIQPEPDGGAGGPLNFAAPKKAHASECFYRDNEGPFDYTENTNPHYGYCLNTPNTGYCICIP